MMNETKWHIILYYESMVGAVRFDSMEVFKEELVFSNLNLYVIENL